MIGRWTTRIVVAAAVLTLLAAACSSSNSPSSGSSGSGGTGSSASAGTTGTGGNTGGGGTTTGGGGGGTSTDTISQANYSFTPSRPSVKSGDTVTGQNIDVTVQPGKSAKVKVDLPAGTYPFVCTFHESLGMTGTLTVS